MLAAPPSTPRRLGQPWRDLGDDPADHVTRLDEFGGGRRARQREGGGELAGPPIATAPCTTAWSLAELEVDQRGSLLLLLGRLAGTI